VALLFLVLQKRMRFWFCHYWNGCIWPLYASPLFFPFSILAFSVLSRSFSKESTPSAKKIAFIPFFSFARFFRGLFNTGGRLRGPVFSFPSCCDVLTQILAAQSCGSALGWRPEASRMTFFPSFGVVTSFDALHCFFFYPPNV